MKREKLTNYSIKGKVDLRGLREISDEVPILAYAVRDRRVLGSAPIRKDGSFQIQYKYKVFGENKEPYGVDLIIGPELPGDQILKTKLERTFLSSKGFKQASPDWKIELAESLVLSDKVWQAIFDYSVLATCQFSYIGFVYTCSPLNDPPGGHAGCVSQEALSSADAEAYVRLSSVSTGAITAEDIEVDLTGRFEKTETWPGISCVFPSEPVKVEVYQKTDAGDHIVYTGPHVFDNNIAEDIFIDRDKVEIIAIPPDPTPGTGNFFGFERIGNIPVEAVYRAGEITGEFGVGTPVPSEFVGYVNSVDKPGVVLGDADRRVKDYAFGDILHLYANIGEDFGTPYPGGVDMSDVSIKYFRIKYSYENPETGETIADTDISVKFHNTRRVPGGTTTEFMGAFTDWKGHSLPHPTYVYPNPYETASNKNWKYRGLILKLDTNRFLRRKYGRYTFTLEPLDEDMNPVTVADPDDLVLTLLIDNDHDALTGEIEDILKDSVGTTVCGSIDLTGTGVCSSPELKVKHTVNDSHGNLQGFSLSARYGQDKKVSFAPPTGDVYSRSGTTPYWNGVAHHEASVEAIWRKCAYEFRLVASRRVTNGFYTIKEKEFTYHVTIKSDTTYSAGCP
jgi:hypothetical protein